MTNEHPSDDERVETDGGTAETPDATANTSDATAEVENENRSLSDLPLSRRTTLALSSAMAVGAGASGAASATDVEVGDPAQGNDGFVSPGADTRVLDLTLDSEDSVIDIDGGSGLDESLYSTVTDDHPTPSPDQEIIPGDLISEFSTQDRVFTDAYETFAQGDDSYFDIDNDSLFQAAGFTNDQSDHPGSNLGYYDTRYVDEFVPFGFTASDGVGNACVLRNTDSADINLVSTEVRENGNSSSSNTFDARYTLQNVSGSTIEVTGAEVEIQNNDGVTVSPGNISVGGNNASGPSTIGGPNGISLSFTLASTLTVSNNASFDIVISGLPDDPAPLGRSPEIETGVTSTALATLANNQDISGNQSATAVPFAGGYSTDISDVINPQLSVKVDSIGIGQGPATAANTDPEADVFTTPGGALKPDVPGNGFVDDPAPNQVSFVDDRRDVTLPNSGRLTAVKRCRVPRGDVAKCVLSPEETTSGHRDLSQVGLEEDFGSLDDGNFVRVTGIDVDGRDRDTVATSFTDPIVLSDNFETDEEELNGNTGYVDFVSAFDIPGEDIAGIELRRLSQTSQASEVLSATKELARFDSTGGALSDGQSVDSETNGFIQVPLNPTSEPDFEIDEGDSLQSSAAEEEMLSRGSIESKTAVAILAGEEDNDAILTESEAYRELELDTVDAYLPQAGSSRQPVATIQSGNDFETPVQIFVAGRFECSRGISTGADGVGSPLEMRANDAVDITRSDRVTFEVQNGASEVDDETGVFYPASPDTGGLIDVEVRVDGEVRDTVTIEVESASSITSVSDLSVVDLRTVGSTPAGLTATAGSSTSGSLPNGLLDPLPSGESIAVSLIAEVELDTDLDGAVEKSGTIELTHQIGQNGSLTTSLNSNDSDVVEVTRVPAGGSGFVDAYALEMGTPGENGTHPDDGGSFNSFRDSTTVEFETTTNAYSGGSSSATVTESYQVEGNYLLAAAARPVREPDQNQPNAYGIYEIGTDNVILVEVTDDTDDVGVVDNAFLDDPQTIAAELESAINGAETPDGREGADVVVAYDPDAHSASGYVIRSTTRVESSFDQNVAVSSVEIGSLAEIVEPASQGALPDAIELSDIGFDPYETDPTATNYYERQDIPRALGLNDRAGNESDFNEVNAATVQNSGSGYTDDLAGPTFAPDNTDRYAARADPLDEVSTTDNNEFLGDNELTGNNLSFGDQLELVGAEDPDNVESDLHQRNPRVLAYYDSQISAVLDAKGGTGVETEFGSGNTLTQSPTRRPGAPNVEEGAFRDFVHNSEPVYNAVEDEAGTTFATDEYPRVRFRMALPNGDFEVPIFGGVSDGTQNPSVFQPLPFYEGFEVIEVGDGITSAADPGVPPTLERDVEQSQDVNRGLGPENTAVQNFYGDRFDGLAIRNAGSVDLDDVREHVLRANEDISREFIQAGQPIDIAGQDRAPLFPQSRPDLAVFYGLTDLDSNGALELLQGRGPVGTFSPDPSQMGGADEYRHFLFTDDQGEELYFGAGSDDDDTTTTDGDDIADSVQLVANAAVSTDVAQGETLQYEVGQLYDHDTDGDYDAVRPGAPASEVSASFQDRGIFFESHDDDGNLAVDVGEVIVDPAAAGGSFDPLGEYDDDGSGDIEADELLNAIDDWRNENIEVGELLQVIDEWRN